MAIAPENTRQTITLPTALLDQLKAHQGAGQTLSDVIRQQLERGYAGLEQQVMDIMHEIQVMRQDLGGISGVLEQVVKTLELMLPTQEIEAPHVTALVEAPRIVSYEEMYADDPVKSPPDLPVQTDELEHMSHPPQEPKRWWHR